MRRGALRPAQPRLRKAGRTAWDGHRTSRGTRKWRPSPCKSLPASSQDVATRACPASSPNLPSPDVDRQRLAPRRRRPGAQLPPQCPSRRDLDSMKRLGDALRHRTTEVSKTQSTRSRDKKRPGPLSRARSPLPTANAAYAALSDRGRRSELACRPVCRPRWAPLLLPVPLRRLSPSPLERSRWEVRQRCWVVLRPRLEVEVVPRPRLEVEVVPRPRLEVEVVLRPRLEAVGRF